MVFSTWFWENHDLQHLYFKVRAHLNDESSLQRATTIRTQDGFLHLSFCCEQNLSPWHVVVLLWVFGVCDLNLMAMQKLALPLARITSMGDSYSWPAPFPPSHQSDGTRLVPFSLGPLSNGGGFWSSMGNKLLLSNWRSHFHFRYDGWRDGTGGPSEAARRSLYPFPWPFSNKAVRPGGHLQWSGLVPGPQDLLSHRQPGICCARLQLWCAHWKDWYTCFSKLVDK